MNSLKRFTGKISLSMKIQMMNIKGNQKRYMMPAAAMESVHGI